MKQNMKSLEVTNRLDTAMKGIRHLDTSAVMVNDHTAFRVD
jgi:hypothetical protein